MMCTVLRKWKYNQKIIQHWVDFEEGGELSKDTTQTKIHEQQRATGKSVKFGKLDTKPGCLDADSDGEPSVESEENSSFNLHMLQLQISIDFLYSFDLRKDNKVTLLNKAMETLLTKTAKLEEILSKLSSREEDRFTALGSQMNNLLSSNPSPSKTCDMGLLRLTKKVQSLKDDMDTLYDGMAASLAKAKKLAGKKKPIPSEFLYCTFCPKFRLF